MLIHRNVQYIYNRLRLDRGFVGNNQPITTDQNQINRSTSMDISVELSVLKVVNT